MKLDTAEQVREFMAERMKPSSASSNHKLFTAGGG